MSEPGTSPGEYAPTHAPEPEVRHRSGLPIVWLVPLVVLAVAAWLIWTTLAEKGPVITISFQTAEGIEAGKTRIRYKNIEIGRVETLRFGEDFSHVVLTVQMAHGMDGFLRRGTRFWVVKPQLGLRGVSGLSTLISGAYIEIEPGEGAPQSHFVGLENPPVVRAETAGRRVTLVSENLGSLDVGSPLYYRGILAGEVLGHELGSDDKSVLIYAFVKAPFDQLVRGNTRFWNVSGIDVAVGSEGVRVRTESLRSVIFGGIAFETPETPEPAPDDLSDIIFTLYPNRASINEKAFTQRLRFVLFFDGSVRGLSIGAPVEFKGIKVGEVIDVRLEFDSSDTSFRIPVVIEIEPERVVSRGAKRVSPESMVSTLVERGLRARLQTGSLITGQLFVELDMHPDTPVRLVAADSPYPELPTIPASLEEITSAAKRFLAKLDKVDLEQLGIELLGTLKGTNQLFNSEQIGAALGDVRAATRRFRSILDKIDKRVDPLASNVDEALSAGRETLQSLQKTLSLVDQVLKSDSPLQYRYIQMADELSETARSIRVFVDLLERNPQSVIFGKPAPGDN